MFIQMQARTGINKFGERTIAALVKQFKKLNDGGVTGKPVVYPVEPATLNTEEKLSLTQLLL